MKHRIEFPNPIERPDANGGRRNWKPVILTTVILLGLLVLFLPWLFSSRIGRNVIKMYLESEYRAQVWMGGLKTSWLGPTTIYRFTMTDPEGRQIKFGTLRAEMGFLGLVAGRLHLGEAEIRDLHVDWVLDHGDGTSTFDRLPASWTSLASTVAPGVGTAAEPIKLPTVSGHIKLVNATVVLTRGQIYRDRHLRTMYRSVRLPKIEGELDIASLDRPWRCELAGEVGERDQAGRFELSGVVDLGDKGRLEMGKATADLTLKLRDLSNALSGERAPLGWVLLPLLPLEDYATALGPSLARVEGHLTAGEGKVRFDHFEAEGKTASGQRIEMKGQPMVDLLSRPRKLGVGGPTVLSVQLTREMARELAALNPFLGSVMDGTGHMELQVEELSLPLVGSLRKLSAKGQMSIRGANLMGSGVLPSDEQPRDLVTQWQALTGSLERVVKLEVPEMGFAVQEGIVSVKPAMMTLDGWPVVLSGQATLGGTMRMTAQIELPERMRQLARRESLSVPITGPTDEPSLELPLSPAPHSPPADKALAEAITQNIDALRDRKMQEMLGDSAREVRELLETVERMNRQAEGGGGMRR